VDDRKGDGEAAQHPIRAAGVAVKDGRPRVPGLQLWYCSIHYLLRCFLHVAPARAPPQVSSLCRYDIIPFFAPFPQAQEAADIAVGNRCEVQPGAKRGSVRCSLPLVHMYCECELHGHLVSRQQLTCTICAASCLHMQGAGCVHIAATRQGCCSASMLWSAVPACAWACENTLYTNPQS